MLNLGTNTINKVMRGTSEVDKMYLGNTLVYEKTARPNSLANLVGWYDASDLSTITDAGSGSVSQWADKSGNNNHFSQSNNTYRPITGNRSINGLNCIEFNGSNSFMQPTTSALASVLSNKDLTVFIVFATDAPASSTGILLLGRNATIFRMRFAPAVTNMITRVNRANDLLIPATINTSPHIVGSRASGANRTSWYGSSVVSDALATAGTYTILILGANSVDPSGVFDGVIAELVIYDRALSDAEAEPLQAYFRRKWAIW